MTKRNVSTAQKTTDQPGDLPTPEPVQKSCAEILDEVNDYLSKEQESKFNALQPCNACQIQHPELPVINSPFEAYWLNTGFDGNNGYLPDNSIDLNWEAGLGTASTPPTSWIPAHVIRNTAWLPSPFNNANWISLYPDAAHSVNVDVYFRYRFYLNSGINLAQFALDMNFYADNSVHEIYVNGVPQSLNYPGLLPQASSGPYSYMGFQAGKEVHISLSKDWKPCENELIVHVKSGPGYVGFLAQNASKCYEAEFPELTPLVSIAWGDSDCDCLETDDFEVMCLTVCNPYSNVFFKDFRIGRIRVVDDLGNAVPILPDGTPSVAVHPVGPYCFGDIAPCSDANDNCVTREFVLMNRGARDGKYKLLLEGVCFEVCSHNDQDLCFTFNLCKS